MCRGVRLYNAVKKIGLQCPWARAVHTYCSDQNYAPMTSLYMEKTNGDISIPIVQDVKEVICIKQETGKVKQNLSRHYFSYNAFFKRT